MPYFGQASIKNALFRAGRALEFGVNPPVAQIGTEIAR